MKKRVLNILTLIATIIIFLIVFESFLRISEYFTIKWQNNVQRQYIEPLENLDYRETPDYEKHDYTIVVIGDSFTYGYGINFSDTYSEILESMIKARRKIDVKIVNLGYPSFNIGEIYYILKTEGIKYDPDLIIYSYYPNDPEINPAAYYYCNLSTDEIFDLTVASSDLKIIKFIKMKTAGISSNILDSNDNFSMDSRGLYRELLNLKLYVYFHNIYLDDNVGWHCSKKIINRFKDIDSEKLFLIIPITPQRDIFDSQIFYEKIIETASKNGFETLDMPSLLQNKTTGRKPSELYHSSSNPHFNRFTNTIIAEGIYQYLFNDSKFIVNYVNT
ncbi:MAG: hypothetical protein ABIJ34_00800 [archaeon]